MGKKIKLVPPIEYLLNKANYTWSTTLNELVKKDIENNTQLIRGFDFEIGHELEFKQGAKIEKEIEKLNEEIKDIRLMFIDKKDPKNGLTSWPEITIPFKRLGFEIARENPQTRLDKIFQKIREDETLCLLQSSKGEIMNLKLLLPDYYSGNEELTRDKINDIKQAEQWSKKNDIGFKDLSIDEIAFEMLYYVVEGASLALYYKELLDKKDKIKISDKTAKKEIPSNPEIALFCEIVNESGIIGKGLYESVPKYIKKVCDHFSIKVSEASAEKVRQKFKAWFNLKGRESQLEGVVNKILPTLPTDEKKKIEEFINNHCKTYN